MSRPTFNYFATADKDFPGLARSLRDVLALSFVSRSRLQRGTGANRDLSKCGSRGDAIPYKRQRSSPKHPERASRTAMTPSGEIRTSRSARRQRVVD